ncbi:MAG: class I SAM-dependent methyltransferase [Acidiferrobacteraceae bacterium]
MRRADVVLDVPRIVRAATINLIARYANPLYLHLTSQTGRARDRRSQETPRDVIGYFHSCFKDYFVTLDVAPADIERFLKGKRLLEYGPGDLPGTSLLMFAHGAEQVVCIDRFPLLALSDKNIRVLEQMMAELPPGIRQRAMTAFVQNGNPASGFNPDKIRYVAGSGLSGISGSVDLIYSRSVLEHVTSLGDTFRDMRQALHKDGVCVHKVDLSSHGLHKLNPLDFLCWPTWLWHAMQGHKGGPNRHRINVYRDILQTTGFTKWHVEPTGFFTPEDISQVRSCLDPEFQSIDDEDLSWKGFWLVQRGGTA